MKKGVRIINCARGGLVDEQRWSTPDSSMSRAPRSLFRRGAGDLERAFGHPNVICTPHLGAATTEAQENVNFRWPNRCRNYLLNGRSPTRQLSLDHPEEAPSEPFIELAEKLWLVRGSSPRPASRRCRSPMRVTSRNEIKR